MVAKLKNKRTLITTMRNKYRSIATFHRPIHSHWSLPLIFSLVPLSVWLQIALYTSRNFVLPLNLIYRLKEGQVFRFRWIWVQEKKLRGIHLQISQNEGPKKKDAIVLICWLLYVLSPKFSVEQDFLRWLWNLLESMQNNPIHWLTFKLSMMCYGR